MYDASDPRSSLNAAGIPGPTQFATADVGKFYETSPQEDDARGRSWLIRSQNAIVIYTEARDEAHFPIVAQVDEYVLLLPDKSVAAEVLTPSGRTSVHGYSLTFIPAGSSEIVVSGTGPIVRFFTTRAAGLAARCVNAQAYETAHPNVAPFRSWPEAKSEPAVRVYSLDIPDETGRFGRIWRCSTFMINYLPTQLGPRDITKLSPHHHNDFEQISLALEGSFMHHLRWPWTPNMNHWLSDQSERCESPSVIVIPPPVIHTSRWMSEGVSQLVDIFCPPRLDFSQKPGWVLNAADYPMPTEA